jgi:DNA-binding GntR family transcriptional regulator
MGAPVGNQNAAKGRRWAAAIERALAKRAGKRSLKDAQEALDELAEQFLDAVSQGDISAFKELGDRLDGKAHQAVTHDGDVGLRVLRLDSDDAGL